MMNTDNRLWLIPKAPRIPRQAPMTSRVAAQAILFLTVLAAAVAAPWVIVALVVWKG
jgi:hypothetical protein